MTAERTYGFTLEEIVSVAIEKSYERGARLLVIDTLAHFARLAEGQEQDSAAMTATLRKVQPAAHAGLAVAVIVHDRKSAGGIATAIRGSSAILASVTRVLSIRPTRENSSIRNLKCIGRSVPTADASRTVELTDAGYQVVGSREAEGSSQIATRRKRRERRASLRLPIGRENALTVAEFAKRHDRSDSWAQSQLNKLCESGQAQRDGRGTRGEPVRYFQPETKKAA